jgi:hypothetical protein
LGSPKWAGRKRTAARREKEQPRPLPPPVPVAAPPARDAHPAIRRMMEVIGKRPRDPVDLHLVPCRGQATFRASEAQRGRALTILDRLCRRLATAGVKIELRSEPNDTHRFALIVEDARGSLRLSLMERLVQTDHVLTVEEKEREKRWGSTSAPKYDHRPSGLLKLELLDRRYTSSLARWVETPSRRLDSFLEDVVARVDQRLLDEQKRAHEAEEERKREALARQRSRVEEERRQHQAALLEDLRSMSRAWHEAKTMGEFLDAAEPKLAALDREDDGQRLQWLAWARESVERLDPTSAPQKIPKVLHPRGTPVE